MTNTEFEKNIELILSENKEGLKNIYTEYISFIYRIVYDVLLNKSSAEDVTSEFFMKLWSIADKYVAGNGHKAWMARIARNMAIDYARKYNKEVLSEDTLEISDSKITDINSRDSEKEVIENMTIEETLSNLKEKERQIVDMKILGEMTFQEISKVLKLPMGTVTWRYQNAIKKLRRCVL